MMCATSQSNEHADRASAYLGKCGVVLPTKPSWHRLPDTDCCPTRATICAMLIEEPLEPQDAMMNGELWCSRVRMQKRPATSRTPFSSPCTRCCTNRTIDSSHKTYCQPVPASQPCMLPHTVRINILTTERLNVYCLNTGQVRSTSSEARTSRLWSSSQPASRSRLPELYWLMKSVQMP